MKETSLRHNSGALCLLSVCQMVISLVQNIIPVNIKEQHAFQRTPQQRTLNLNLIVCFLGEKLMLSCHGICGGSIPETPMDQLNLYPRDTTGAVLQSHPEGILRRKEAACGK